MPALLDQEIVFLELGALHFIAHPDRRHTATSPLERLVFLRLILWLWFCAPALPAAAWRDGSSGGARLLRDVAPELRKLALQVSALRANLFGQGALKVFDMSPKLRDIHCRYGLADRLLIL